MRAQVADDIVTEILARMDVDAALDREAMEGAAS
jgi:hypothetical protein